MDRAAIDLDHTTPAEIAECLMVSERRTRNKARQIGACTLIGKQMILFPRQVQALLEAFTPCPSLSTVAAKSGTTAVPQPKGDYEALRAQRTKPLPKGLRQKPKQERETVILMDQRRK